MSETKSYSVSLQLCNDHLIKLFRAIERGDVDTIYRIEHQLSPTEECIACAYSLRAHGLAKEVLDTFLHEEGYIGTNVAATQGEEIRYWLTRVMMLGGLFFLFLLLSSFVKSWITDNPFTLSLSAFSIVGLFMISIASYIFLEFRILE